MARAVWSRVRSRRFRNFVKVGLDEGIDKQMLEGFRGCSIPNNLVLWLIAEENGGCQNDEDVGLILGSGSPAHPSSLPGRCLSYLPTSVNFKNPKLLCNQSNSQPNYLRRPFPPAPSYLLSLNELLELLITLMNCFSLGRVRT